MQFTLGSLSSSSSSGLNASAHTAWHKHTNHIYISLIDEQQLFCPYSVFDSGAVFLLLATVDVKGVCK